MSSFLVCFLVLVVLLIAGGIGLYYINRWPYTKCIHCGEKTKRTVNNASPSGENPLNIVVFWERYTCKKCNKSHSAAIV